MPDQPDDGPPLTPEATTHAGTISRLFHERLKTIAKQLAKSNGCEFTQKRDINIALKAVKDSGHDEPKSPPPLHKRPEFHICLGPLLIGLSPSIGGWAHSGMTPHQQAHPGWFFFLVFFVPVIVCAVGVAMTIVGWCRN